MRLTLVISSLGAGGAERVLSGMANYWAVRGRQVTLITLSSSNEPPFYPLAPNVIHIPLGVQMTSPGPVAGVLNNVVRLKALREAICQSRPNVIVSFIDQVNVLTLLATTGLSLPVIVSERIDPTLYRLAWIWELARRWTYPRATQVVVQTAGVATYFRGLRTRVIPNPVPRQLLRSTSEHRTEQPVLLAMGRLVDQKGFDLLLHAFSKIASRFPEWSLQIWGEGPKRQALEQLRRELGLSRQVTFPGYTRKTSDVMRAADLFVLSSRFEGFPNVLCEAMACGLPIVSFDCPSGPAEIIRHEHDGLLVPAADVAALASALERAMKNANDRDRWAANASTISDRFDQDRVMALWEDVIDESISKYRNNKRFA
jgi:glycosyltransferase involved in cell wall biosynthesis